MKKFSFFPIIVTGVLVFAAIIAVLIFSGFLPGYKNRGAKGQMVKLVMWGTLPKQQIDSTLTVINRENKNSFNVQYVQKQPSSYEDETVEALASGKGPDLLLVSQDMLLENKDRIYTIPFVLYPERDFLDVFVDGGEVYLNRAGGGSWGLPFLIDPIVLYWNKDMFSSAGISQPPKDWEEFMVDALAFTEKNDAGNIDQSGAALGEFANIAGAKDILSMMIMQAGDSIVKTDSRGNLRVALEEGRNKQLSPTESSVKFFNEFSNPVKSNYSWNKALPRSDEMFAKGSLAMYFGYASEINGIRSRNPHLNFDLAETPQIKEGKSKLTFGRIYGLAVLKNSFGGIAGGKLSLKQQAIMTALKNLSSARSVKSFSLSSGVGPARRDVAGEKSANDAYFSLVNKMAIMSKAWLDPDRSQTYQIFKDMAESAASGRDSLGGAVSGARNRLDKLLKMSQQ